MGFDVPFCSALVVGPSCMMAHWHPWQGRNRAAGNFKSSRVSVGDTGESDIQAY
jgi:hypothetical protein